MVSLISSPNPRTQPPHSDTPPPSPLNNTRPKVRPVRSWPIMASQLSLLIIRVASIIVLGLGIAFLTSNPMVGWALLIAAVTLAITSLVCAIAISIYQTLTIRKLQKEVSSLEKRSGLVFIEPNPEENPFAFDSPFAGLEDELSSPISPCLSLEDHFYIEDLVAKAEAESLEKLC
ncbi:hypothetical protein [Chlamydia suis]|uniref:Uncharacterized protein n=1 Tax=Chlamydia suis TaxID=83559 RepID=A0AAQ0EM56_9CHLA|nr:hypothetical protein [Chlamydia suis]QYC74344.1 hypothetical protein INQ84_04550 [Chlamydia suis]QYC75253.1 hypothetical protein INQ85_04580 [Chlamydia suis]QYC76167.1 hypothetical protein INQ86_04535 [Chlamydia suis]QYC77077.1 hypothetical protein INQ87_04490 [Chlamydia suis]QYC77977.1 hypothetical protein INQ88_04495 [Chlamydia suis]